MLKNYLLKVIENSSPDQLGQDAVEWAIISGHVHLSGDLPADLRLIATRYAEILEGYRRVVADNEAAMVDAFAHSGLIEEILRPVPLSITT